MNVRHTFVCDGSNEGILTALFNAFSYRNKNRISSEDIDIVIDNDGYMLTLFGEYEKVEIDSNKVYKTLSSIYNKLGREVYDNVIYALCHFDDDRAYVVFRFLEVAFRVGPKALSMYSDRYVARFLEISNKVARESHLFLGIVRFCDISGMLFAEIEPKCNVIPLITDHFSDRYPGENWIIYDKIRSYGAIHSAGKKEVVLERGQELENFRKTIYDNDKAGLMVRDEYEDLWKVFFETIAIKERSNYKCQRNLIPLWMRKNMTEFK